MSNMSHELRTPLNSIISLSNILVRKVKDIISEKELGYLKIIQKNGKGLLAIINDILDLSRIDAGKERIDYAVFSLHSLVESVIEIVLPQAQEKKVKIVNNINPQLPHIKSDIKNVNILCKI